MRGRALPSTLFCSEQSRIDLHDGKKLLLKKGEEWKDEYLEDILLPLLRGTAPLNAKRAPSSSSAEVWRADAGDQTLFVKFFKARGIKDVLPLRKSRGLRAAEGGELLREKGFQSPGLIAQGDVTRGFRIMSSFLVLREIEDSVNLYDYIAAQFNDRSGDGLREKRDFLDALGGLIGRLHKSGIIHGDLRPGNVFVGRSGKGVDFYFLDNERTTYFPDGISMRLRQKNLVQINMIAYPQVTSADRMRFFNAYLKENPEILPAAGKELMLEVFLSTRRRLLGKIPGIRDTR